MSDLTYPYVIITQDRHVQSRHKTAEAAFKKARKLRARFEPHAVLEVRNSEGAVSKGAVVTEKWVREEAARISFDPLTKTTKIITFGWY